jgi:hypothetical protein
MSERWKTVPGWPEYQVSSLGRVKSIHFGKERIRKTYSDMKRGGYPKLIIMREGKRRAVKVCILVLESFVGPKPKPNYVCAHLNGNPADSRLENLAWVTPRENSSHMRIHGTLMLGSAHKRAKLSDAQVLEIRRKYKRYSHSSSNAVELAKEFGVSKRSIQAITGRKAWQHI